MTDSGRPKIVIIGAGFAGLGMAIQLKRHGFHDFVVLEKNAELGGTWHDNTYPGCACDVPAPMYSYSFALNPHWTRLFAHQPEIHDYLRDCAHRYDVVPHIRYNTAVESLEWDDQTKHWQVVTTDGETCRCRAVVSGIGALHVPSYPSIAGAETFAGQQFHTARWNHDHDLNGKRVAVIGTGASAIQAVPAIAPRVERLHLFQRTPPWVMPRPDVPFPQPLRTAFRAVPGTARALRYLIYWAAESRAAGLQHPERSGRVAERIARRHIARHVPDEHLRAALTPDYRIGCKRVLTSSDYYPALVRPNVDVITEGIERIRPEGLVTEDGREHDVDAIIYATGFKVTDTLTDQRITGRDGLKIQDAWADGVEAHYGITVPGFPNYFMLLGPNTGLGHNSVVFMIETQIQHVLSCLRLMRARRADTIEVTAEATRRFNDRIQNRLRTSVWSQGGCDSWYLDHNGVNRTLWPGHTYTYRHQARRAVPSAHTFT